MKAAIYCQPTDAFWNFIFYSECIVILILSWDFSQKTDENVTELYKKIIKILKLLTFTRIHTF